MLACAAVGSSLASAAAAAAATAGGREPPAAELPVVVSLALFVAAVYGASWLVTRSRAGRPVRRVLSPLPVLGPLSRCVVCTAFWAALGAGVGLLARPSSSALLAPLARRLAGPADVAVLTLATAAAAWALARALGDAD